MLAVTLFEATISFLIIRNGNKCFSFGTPGYRKIPNYLPEGIFDKLKELLKLRSENDFELHVKEVEKRGTCMDVEKSGILCQVLIILYFKFSPKYAE